MPEPTTSRRPRRRPLPELGVSEQAATPVPEVKPEVLPAAAPVVKAPETSGPIPQGDEVPIPQGDEVPKRVGLASTWPGPILVQSAPSGSIYKWGNAGAIVQVLESDLAHLLAKNRNDAHGCCGSGGPRIYFVLV